MSNLPSDAALWERLRADDRDAWGLLFDRHAHRVYRFAARMAGESDAEEILADTFLEVWRSRRSFVVNDDSALPVLMAIARRVAQKRARTVFRRRRLWDLVARYQTPDEGQQHDPADDVVRRSELAGQRAWLREQVSALPPAWRDVFELSVYAELSNAEVAALLEVPVGTVKSRLSRSRQALIDLHEASAPRSGAHLQEVRTGE